MNTNPKLNGQEEMVAPVTHQHRVKRMLFIASLYFKIIGVKNPSISQLEEINKRFHLAFRWSSLRLPAAMSSVVWGKADFAELAKRYRAGETTASQVTGTVLNCVPGWCRYDTEPCIQRDIKAVFDCVC